LNTKKFKIWIEKNNIINQTFSNFKECFELYQKQQPNEFFKNFGEFSDSKLEVYLYSIDLRVNCLESIDDEIISTIRIRYDGKYLGQYRLVFDLSGNIVDDVFVIE
jgi:hypothetical protein